MTSVLDGYNVCIFAYGQTGSGKTYTMTGPPEDRGCNLRALQDLFAKAADRRGDTDDKIKVSVIEVYNEQIRDLLSDNVCFDFFFLSVRTPPPLGRRQEARGPARRARRPRPIIFFLPEVGTATSVRSGT